MRLGFDVLDARGVLLREFGAADGLRHDDGEGTRRVVLVFHDDFVEGGGDGDARREASWCRRH